MVIRALLTLPDEALNSCGLARYAEDIELVFEHRPLTRIKITQPVRRVEERPFVFDEDDLL